LFSKPSSTIYFAPQADISHPKGCSVVRELLQQPDVYHVRALTRNPSKSAARALVELGAEVQHSGLDDGRDALAVAFTGAHIIYALTVFWQTQSATAEFAQSKAIAEAAAQTTILGQFVWSTLPDPVKLSEGRYLNVHHWKSKSLKTDYIERKQSALWAKTIAIAFPNYFENCINFPRTYLPTKVSVLVQEPTLSP
jgi:hypothetical protein